MKHNTEEIVWLLLKKLIISKCANKTGKTSNQQCQPTPTELCFCFTFISCYILFPWSICRKSSSRSWSVCVCHPSLFIHIRRDWSNERRHDNWSGMIDWGHSNMQQSCDTVLHGVWAAFMRDILFTPMRNEYIFLGFYTSFFSSLTLHVPSFCRACDSWLAGHTHFRGLTNLVSLLEMQDNGHTPTHTM